MMAFKAGLVWLCLLMLAMANGFLRESLIVPRFGPKTGHVLSTLILSALIVLLAWWTIAWIGPETTTDGWKIGAQWLLLTVAFEFLAGRYLFHKPWSQLLADYNVVRGRIWILALLSTLFAPRWAASRILTE